MNSETALTETAPLLPACVSEQESANKSLSETVEVTATSFNPIKTLPTISSSLPPAIAETLMGISCVFGAGGEVREYHDMVYFDLKTCALLVNHQVEPM
jgi:hypothetical protein